METNFTCPVCKNNQWKIIETKTYTADAVSKCDNYSKIRYQVLFEVWLGRQNEISLNVIICKMCGFLCYRPRPDEHDISKKYRFLNKHPDAKIEYALDLKSDKKRSRELYRVVKHYITGPKKKILDFGGGKGRLLHKFVEIGHHCAVLDLVDEVIPGVEYAGCELSDFPENKRYDLIICSHVIEHLAGPLDALLTLKKYIAKDGYIYIEVPSEIWRTPPPRIDPVTHINFFTTDSLRTLMQVAGILPLKCNHETFTRPNGMVGMAIKAVGVVKDLVPNEIMYSGTTMVDRLIDASLYDRIFRMINHPRLLKNLLT